MIYLDYQASTPLAPEARAAMLAWLGSAGKGASGPQAKGAAGDYGNPHSVHKAGRKAAAAVELARAQVAALCPPGGRVIFTSGATEALNLALGGSAETGDVRPLAISALEHPAVREPAARLGAPITTLGADREGLVQPDPSALAKGTRLVAVMQVNNEIGTIQPVASWYEIAREAGALFLCDGVQAAGKIPLAEADMIALSAHKLYGPIGIGAFWLRDGVELRPVQTGGAQEGGLRAGTLSPALCAGFGAAAQLAQSQMAADAAHVEALWEQARSLFSDWTLNGSAAARWHGNLNIRRPGLDAARLISECREVAFSAGSACASGAGRPSAVLKAIGLSSAEAKSAIRLGFGRYTSAEELEEAAEIINRAAKAQDW